MPKGINIKCKNCIKTFWIEIKLSFGARKNKDDIELLNCLLNEVRFYFRCPYCNQDILANAGFFTNKPPELAQIVENPHYIG